MGPVSYERVNISHKFLNLTSIGYFDRLIDLIIILVVTNTLK